MLVVAQAPAAFACTCLPLPVGDPLDVAGRHRPSHDHAFIGSVRSVGAQPVKAGRKGGGEGYEPGRYVPVVLEVEVTLTGKVPDPAIVLQQTGQSDTCSFKFEENRRYLVEARKTADGTFLIDICTFTQAYGTVTADTVDDTGATPRGSPVAPILVLVLLALGAGAILRLTFRQRET